jgi:hypothetical protein
MPKPAFILLVLLSSFILAAQDADTNENTALAAGYRDFKLGQTMEEVRTVLRTSDDFIVRKEEILTIRLEPDTEIISSEGRGFIDKGYFHFHEDSLFQILLKIDEKKIGYYVLLKQLTGRYGDPALFTPQFAEWDDGVTTITLEKPCTLKYRDRTVWQELTSGDVTSDVLMEKTRLRFLENL